MVRYTNFDKGPYFCATMRMVIIGYSVFSSKLALLSAEFDLKIHLLRFLLWQFLASYSSGKGERKGKMLKSHNIVMLKSSYILSARQL